MIYIMGKWKMWLGLIMIFILKPLHAQLKVQLFDSISKQAVSDVYLYDSTGRLLAISNLNGVCLISPNSQLDFTLKHYGYETRRLRILEDSIFLKPIFKEVQETEAKGMKPETLYNHIVAKSRSNLNVQTLYGKVTYFHTTYAYYRDIITNEVLDTLIFNAQVKSFIKYQYNQRKKKHKISYYPFAGEIEVWSRKMAKEKRLNDKNMPPFPFIHDQIHLWDYDLADPSFFQLRDNYKWKLSQADSVADLTMTKEKMKDTLESRVRKISYQINDSTAMNYRVLSKIHFQKINTFGYRLVDVNYSFKDSIYFVKSTRHELYAYPFNSELQLLVVDEIGEIKPPGFEGLKEWDLNKYLYSLPYVFKEVNPLVLPENDRKEE